MAFKESKLSDLCEIVSSKRVFAASYQSEGIPFYRGKEVSQLARGEKTTAELYISEDVYTDVVSRTGPINPGDILLTAVGTLGNPYQVKDADLPFYFKDGNIVWLRKFSKEINPTYLFYWLNSEYGRRKVLDTSIGSTQAALTITGLGAISISCPSLAQQTGIVRILSAIDQKITMNNALSKTLEDIAQTIFKSWFIDYDPVKAKIAGEKPGGMDTATAALFPDSMEESELGLVPKGWEVRALDEISDYLNGLAMQKFPVIDENEQMPVIKIAQLRAGNTKGADMASSLLEPKFIIKDGDILFSWSGTLEVEIWAGGPGALNQHLFKVTGKNVPDWYSYLSTKSFLSFFRGIASGKATTMGHIQRGHLTESKLAIPNLELMNRVTEIIEPIISLKTEISVESRHLAEIRDSLLPRLISGELQIPEEMLAS
jgi:type I restriction enzyme S subunit